MNEQKNDWLKQNIIAFHDEMMSYKNLPPEERRLLRRKMNFRLEIISVFDNNGDNVLNSRINENHDRLLHHAAARAHPDILKLLIKHKADVNAPNQYGQRALREAILRPADPKNRQQVKEKRDVIRLLLTSGAKLFAKDAYKKSNFSILPAEYHPLVLQLLFPSSVYKSKTEAGWTKDQKKTKIEQLLLADYGNFDVEPLLTDEPPSDEDVAFFVEANRSFDQYGKYKKQRSSEDMIYHFDDFCRRIVKSIFLPEFIQLFGDYEAEGFTLRDHIINDLGLGDLTEKMNDDMAISDFIVGYLSQAVAHKLFDVDSKGKKNPAGNLTKMVRTIQRFLRNDAKFNAEIDKRPEALLDIAKKIYEDRGKRTDIIEWESLFKDPLRRGKYFVGELRNSEELLDEATEQQNCWYGYLMNCMLRNEHVLFLREDPNDPLSGYAFGVQVTATTKSGKEPDENTPDEDLEVTVSLMGNIVNFQNVEEPSKDILHAVDTVLTDLNNPSFFNAKKFFREYTKGAKERNLFYDKLLLIIGYPYKGEEAEEFSANAATIFTKLMGGLIRNPANIQLFKEFAEVITLSHLEEPRKKRTSRMEPE